MVVALKEVKIRGEIRTTVDYCVEMIQSPDFVGNNIHTGWLDARISSHVGALSATTLAERTHVIYGRLVCHCQQAYSCQPLRGDDSVTRISSHVGTTPPQREQQQQPC